MYSSWYEALVISLSILLGVFLILSIILLVKLIQIAKLAKRITEHAESVADKAEHIGAFFEKTATPVALFKLVANFSEAFQKKGRRK